MKLVDNLSTEDSIKKLMESFDVSYTAIMFTLGELNMLLKDKLKNGVSLTDEQHKSLELLLKITCDGKTNTTPAQMAKAIFKSVFNNNADHFQTPEKLKENIMNTNQANTDVPVTFFQTIFDAAVGIEFNDKWSNGTGYFDAAVESEYAPKVPSGAVVKTIDDQGRKILIFGGEFGNVVIFQRYTDSSDTLVKNVSSNFAKFYNNFPSGLVSEEDFASLVNDDLEKFKTTPVEEPAKEQAPWPYVTQEEKPVVPETSKEEPAKVIPEAVASDPVVVTPWYKNPWVIGAGVVAIGAAVVVAARK